MSSMDATTSTVPPIPFRQKRRRLLAILTVALLAGIGAARYLESRGAVSYAGRLQSRTTSIVVGRSAKLAAVLVADGQRVVPGDKLLELTDDKLTASIGDKKRELLELDADLNRVKAVAEVELEWRKRELRNDVFQTQLKVTAITQERISKQVEQLAWRDHLNDYDGLAASGPALAEAIMPIKSSIIDARLPNERRLQVLLREDAAAAATEALDAQLNLCEQQLERLKKLEEELPDKVRRSIGIELSETRVTRAREELGLLEKQLDSLIVVSPAHGLVGAVKRSAGDHVESGETVLELFDDERRHLIAHIPSAELATMRPGTKVTLIFPPSLKRIGLVASIPPRTMLDKDLPVTDETLVAVKIEPAGKLWPRIPVGSRVNVQVPQQ